MSESAPQTETRFAIVGCGMMGQRHAEILSSTPGARVVAVFDKDAAPAKKVADSVSGPTVRVSESYEALLTDAEVDGVVLCLPSGMHAEFGVKAARAKKHVVTEKPIDIDPAAGAHLTDECLRAGVQCAVISQNRFADGPAALKAALDRGDLGKPVLVESSVRWFRHDKYYAESDWRGRVSGEGGGVIMNQAIHTIDLLLWMFGEPEAVHGMVTVNRPLVMETEDVAVAILKFRDGPMATLTASTSTFPGFEEEISVYGPKASASVRAGKLALWKAEDESAAPNPPDFAPATPGLSSKYTLFQRQYRNILAAIAGREPLLVTPQESIAVVRTARAIYDPVYSRRSEEITPARW